MYGGRYLTEVRATKCPKAAVAGAGRDIEFPDMRSLTPGITRRSTDRSFPSAAVTSDLDMLFALEGI
jgi:hypothetical protein